MGSSRLGYEYRYRVSEGDEPKEEDGEERGFCRRYLLEVRTNFILKPLPKNPPGEIEIEIVMDTERFDEQVLLDYPVPDSLTWAFSGPNMVDDYVRSRLSKYSMPHAQIRSLCQTTYDFFRHPRYNSSGTTISILLSIDVCTIQLEGEPLDVTIDRSVKPDFLLPLELRWAFNSPKSELRSYLNRLLIVRVTEEEEGDVEDLNGIVETCSICLDLVGVCLETSSPAENYVVHRTHSVSQEEGLGLMEVCPICLREPVVGTNIASLIPCKHAFHQHCVARWLMKSNSCPVCRVEIVFEEEDIDFL